ncbi:MAG TPA: glycosyltransferase family 9 protein [Azospirillum sp.]|nr:glycosyltransferase family 9 protein [Azospirillum sp.]
MISIEDALARGDAHYHAGRLSEAEVVCRAVLIVEPRHGGALHRLGILAHAAGDYSRAARLLTAAVTSGEASAHGNLAVVLMKAGFPDAALTHFHAAHALAPRDARAGYNLAMALLGAGALEEGFRLYEQRWRLKGPTPWISRWDLFWDGRPLDGRILLAHAEQGFGDSIQFARYVALAAARGAQVILAVPRALQRLMEGLDGCARVLSEGESVPAYAAHVPLMSLPRIFGTTEATIPASVPYIRAPSSSSFPLPRSAGLPLRVGLVWAGRAEDPEDAQRSCPLERLAPLLTMAGVEFHSLQKGPPEAGLDGVVGGDRVIRHGDSLQDFADTAALVAGLDLVIGVDTAVIHLAGALARPVWTLLSADPDWRWMRGRTDSPWYPTMRLFRQPVLGDWTTVIADVAQSLRRFGRDSR